MSLDIQNIKIESILFSVLNKKRSTVSHRHQEFYLAIVLWIKTTALALLNNRMSLLNHYNTINGNKTTYSD